MRDRGTAADRNWTAPVACSAGPGSRGDGSRAPFALVATVGPASADHVDALVGAGANGLRINASHLTHDEVVAGVTRVRSTVPGVRIVVDLQGAKLRLGRFEPAAVRPGDRVRFVCGPPAPGDVPIPHPELFEQLQRGATLGIDDGRLRFRVREGGTDWCETEADVAGTLRPRKGVTVVEHPITLADLSVADARLCQFADTVERVELACSYLTDGREATWIRRRAPRARVIGKVERRAAIDAVTAIEGAVDEIWICRGDLGAEIGALDLARWIAAYRPPPAGPPVLMAGQVLEHLTHHADPTRSEVCHLFDLLARGYAGIVLSDETAIGVAPEAAVRVASALLRGFHPIG